jgi:hypothetical protein
MTERDLAGGRTVRAVGVFLALTAVLSLAALAVCWQASLDQATSSGTVFGLTWRLGADTKLLLLVAASSAVGSCVHGITSYVTFVGNRRFRRSWVAWYLMRVLVGMSLAVVAYAVSRAGLTSASSGVDPAGAAAIGGLSGLFSKQAADKLREIFDVTFRTAPLAGDGERGDKADSADASAPRVAVVPSRWQQGTAGDLVVLGDDFHPGSVVVLAAQVRAAVFRDPSSLLVHLLSEDVSSAGEVEVRVFDPVSGTLSLPAPLTVSEPVAS